LYSDYGPLNSQLRDSQYVFEDPGDEVIPDSEEEREALRAIENTGDEPEESIGGAQPDSAGAAPGAACKDERCINNAARLTALEQRVADLEELVRAELQRVWGGEALLARDGLAPYKKYFPEDRDEDSDTQDLSQEDLPFEGRAECGRGERNCVRFRTRLLTIEAGRVFSQSNSDKESQAQQDKPTLRATRTEQSDVEEPQLNGIAFGEKLAQEIKGFHEHYKTEIKSRTSFILM
jgi:hypothetical protein